ncbi:MAG: hypothetical protein JWN09_2334 [Microbacteriaceae bacterium]|nr:hypothetical protein [Microbacteriaceae bacterium]
MLVVGGAEQASALTPPSIGLGAADSYEVLAATTVTNTLATVVNNGDVGLSPGTSVTGFPPGVINNGVIHAADAQAEQAQASLVTAYNDAAGRLPDESNIIDLAGRTLVPGVYSGGALALTGALTLNGDASSVFIFQAASTLITASASTVQFIGGANECNVFWQVGSSATLGSNSVFYGTIMALTSVTANTGATVTGRLLARNGAVTLDSNVITRSSACAPRSAIVASTPSSATLAQQAAAVAAARAAAATAAAAAARAAELAATGSNPTVPVTAGVLLLGSGLLLFVLGRRKATRRHRP